MNLLRLLVLTMVGTCGLGHYARAAEPLNLEAAIARALASNPALSAENATLAASKARAERDALPTPYVIGGDLENVAGSGALNGASSAESTIRIGRVIELGDKQGARRSVGDADINRQRNLADAIRVDVISLTKSRFVAVLAGQQRLAYAQQQVQQADRTRREVSSWVKAARNPESDLRAAEIAAAEAELLQESAEHELASARMTLAASWGDSKPGFDTVSGNLLELPPVAPFDELSGRLADTASLRAAKFDADLVSAKRRLHQANGKPDVTISLGVRRLEAIDSNGLVMSVSVPLGSLQRSRLEVAESDAQLSAIESRRQSRQVESHQALFAVYQELMHARTEFDALHNRMIPKAEQALAFIRRGFEAGRFSFVSLAAAQKTLFDLRVRSLEAATRYHTHLVEVERLTAIPTESNP